MSVGFEKEGEVQMDCGKFRYLMLGYGLKGGVWTHRFAIHLSMIEIQNPKNIY